MKTQTQSVTMVTVSVNVHTTMMADSVVGQHLLDINLIHWYLQYESNEIIKVALYVVFTTSTTGITSIPKNTL